MEIKKQQAAAAAANAAGNVVNPNASPNATQSPQPPQQPPPQQQKYRSPTHGEQKMPSLAPQGQKGLPNLVNQGQQGQQGHGANYGHASQAQAHAHALQQQQQMLAQQQKQHKHSGQQSFGNTSNSVSSNTGSSLPPILGMSSNGNTGGSNASQNMTNGQLTKEVNKLLTKANGSGHSGYSNHSQGVQKKRKKYRLNYGVQDSKPRDTSQVLKAYGLK
jgi:hypothetical protein